MLLQENNKKNTSCDYVLSNLNAFPKVRVHLNISSVSASKHENIKLVFI
jgi:hypothetical protein